MTFRKKRWATRVLRLSDRMKSVSWPCLSTALSQYFHLPPTGTYVSSTRHDQEREP